MPWSVVARKQDVGVGNTSGAVWIYIAGAVNSLVAAGTAPNDFAADFSCCTTGDQDCARQAHVVDVTDADYGHAQAKEFVGGTAVMEKGLTVRGVLAAIASPLVERIGVAGDLAPRAAATRRSLRMWSLAPAVQQQGRERQLELPKFLRNRE